MFETDDNGCERSCQRLVIASYSLMDQGDYDGCASLFAPDATWVRGGKPVQGRAAIREALNQRPADQVSRHIVTNVLVRQDGASTATATAVFIPIRGVVRENGTCAMPAISALGDLRYTFVRTEGRWLIQTLQPSMTFV